MDDKKLVFVNSILDNKIAIFCKDELLKNNLKKIGFTNNLILEYRDKTDLAKKLMQIRDLDIPFSYGREWSPAQIIKHLKSENLFQGEFNEITWANPHHWLIYKVDIDKNKKIINECNFSLNQFNESNIKKSSFKRLFKWLNNLLRQNIIT